MRRGGVRDKELSPGQLEACRDGVLPRERPGM